MAENIKLEVVTPERSIVSELASIIMAPGTLGEFGVLSGHTPFLTTLRTGSMKYTSIGGHEKFVFISAGFAEALPNKVTILAESAEKREDIDVQRAKNSAKRAERRLSNEGNNMIDSNESIDFDRARFSLFRAIQRIKLAETAL